MLGNLARHNSVTPSAHATTADGNHCGITTEHEDNFKSTIVVYADCHASNRGLFAGLILVVVTIVFIILFFIAVNDE